MIIILLLIIIILVVFFQKPIIENYCRTKGIVYKPKKCCYGATLLDSSRNSYDSSGNLQSSSGTSRKKKRYKCNKRKPKK